MKPLIQYIEESFDMDEEIIARYRYILKHKAPMDEMDIDDLNMEMWNSMGELTKQQLIRDIKFTGFINDDVFNPSDEYEEELTILVPCNRKDMFDYLSDEISNHLEYQSTDDDGYNQVCIGYNDGILRINDYDWADSPHIYPSKKWGQQIDRKANWIINESIGTYWVSSDIYIKQICQYTGWHFYKNGKLVK